MAVYKRYSLENNKKIKNNMMKIRNKIYVILAGVLAIAMISVSCEQPTADQLQFQEEESATDIATSFDVIAPLSRLDARSRECPQPAVNMYLKLEGIDGESTDVQHEGEIDVLSWSWEASVRAASTIAGRGPGMARVSVQDISLTKWVDKASPELRRFAASGEPIPEAVLTLRTTCGDEQELYEIKMEPIYITSYQTGGSSSQILTEFISFNYSEIALLLPAIQTGHATD
jgi:type VI secretion system secreted protein Hcp